MKGEAKKIEKIIKSETEKVGEIVKSETKKVEEIVKSEAKKVGDVKAEGKIEVKAAISASAKPAEKV